MSLTSAETDIDYPESDGKPMGETDVHRAWMHRVYELLSRRYADNRVYVGCNLLVYYAQGNPIQFCVPDVFVVLNSDPGPRRVFKTWVERRVPDVVFEITSKSTRREDEVFKPETYARIGVQEYFLYDPTTEYLDPPLIGFRLSKADRQPILPDAGGVLQCRALGLKLWLDEGELELADSLTGQRLLTAAEQAAVAEERATVAEDRVAAADERAAAADARAAAAEGENRRLREELAKLQKPSDGQSP